MLERPGLLADGLHPSVEGHDALFRAVRSGVADWMTPSS